MDPTDLAAISKIPAELMPPIKEGEEDNSDAQFKVIVVGDTGVGKSSIL